MVVKSNRFIENNPLVDSNMCILVTSFDGHLMFIKNTLSKYVLSKKYVICSFDKQGTKIPEDIFKTPHSWTFKHLTHGAEKRNGWLWDIVYGAGIIGLFENFEYIFTVNGDCVWDKPQGIDSIINLLGDNDLMSSSVDSTIHTCSVIWKREAFLDFISYIRYNLNTNRPESYSPEILLRDWAKDKNVKVPDIQAYYPEGHFHEGAIDHYNSYHQDSTWKRLLGYRNLGGEHKWSCLEHLEPVPKTYCDFRDGGRFLSQHEKTTLLQYYLTLDRRWLYMYWDQGEDSWYNRKYHPLEHYGNKALYDDSMRKELGPDSERKGLFNRFDLDFMNKEEK
jgi:hypothetical protein